MKKHLLSVIAASSVLTAFAQLPVSTTVQNKKVVIEEFTGLYCGYCPDGHLRANAIYNADPNNVILVNIHSGGFANVAAGEPDMKTADGDLIDPMPTMGITGYPAGDVNRTIYGSTSVMASDRGTWLSRANAIKSQTAYCNVALEGHLDAVTRMLTVTAQVYYTGNSPVATNNLSIFLLEDAIPGPQHNYGYQNADGQLYNKENYNVDGTYNHNHVLRKALTPTFGTAIATTTTGSMFTYTASYAVPATYGAAGKTNACVLGNLRLAAFVTESNVNTINAAHGPILFSGLTNTRDAATSNLVSEKLFCAGILNPKLKLSNMGTAPITDAVLSHSVNGVATGTFAWSAPTPADAIAPLSISKTIYMDAVNFTPLATGSNTLTVDILSVNGAADQNLPNNVSLFKTITKSTYTAGSLDVTMAFSQDAFGSQSIWNVYNEVTGDLIETDGPFADLDAAGTLVHEKTFTLEENTCYKLEVKDAFFDGINSTSYGHGGYKLKTDDGNTMYSSTGFYGAGETMVFKTYSAVGLAKSNMNISKVNVYPNPASGTANVAITMEQNDALNISVINSIGQEVYTVKTKTMDAGANTVSLNTENWSAGVYFINISSPKGSVKEKLVIAK